jgi:plasmid stability protein
MMPTLVVENVPADVYESLRKRAAAGRRSLPEEMLDLLGQIVRADAKPSARLPDLHANEEFSAPYDLPRSSSPVQISAHRGQIRLLDPLPEEAAE